MSRKISKQAAEAFLASKPFSRSGNGRTSVMVYKNCPELFLHGNCIAKLENGKLSITTAGWNTSTTRERLNALPNVHVYQRKGVLHLNGKPWDGNWTEVSSVHPSHSD